MAAETGAAVGKQGSELAPPTEFRMIKECISKPEIHSNSIINDTNG